MPAAPIPQQCHLRPTGLPLGTCFGTGREYFHVGLQRNRPDFDAPETSPDRQTLRALHNRKVGKEKTTDISLLEECRSNMRQPESNKASALFERMGGRGQELVGSRSCWHAHHSSATSYGGSGTNVARCDSASHSAVPIVRAPAV